MDAIADLMPAFVTRRIDAGEVTIHCAVAGSGPGLLLLHGHPQTLVVWRKVAPRFVAAGYTVVAADLRGYGDSDKPEGGPRSANYAKRAMARDQVAVMRRLGFERFAVVGHDRGGRVAHRMALDHPQAVDRLVLVDIAPTATMYARTDKDFATSYFWWFFLIQPFDLPERMIGADPEFFLWRHVESQSRTPGAVEPAAFAEYLRCYRDPRMIHAACEDYRAAAGIDLEHDTADAAVRVAAPLLALWGARGVVGQTFDVLQTWREKALDVSGAALPCGHAVPEEAPDAFAEAVLAFLSRR